MARLTNDINTQVEITTYTLRKLFLGFLRTYWAGDLLVFSTALKDFKYDGTVRGLRVDLIDLDEKDKFDSSTGIYLISGDTTYSEHTTGGRGTSNLMEGSRSYQVEGVHTFKVRVVADSSDEANMLADNVFYFILSLKGMLDQPGCGIGAITGITVTGQSKASRLDDRRHSAFVSFHVTSTHAVVSIPETHLLHTIDLKTFQDTYINTSEEEGDPAAGPDAMFYNGSSMLYNSNQMTFGW